MQSRRSSGDLGVHGGCSIGKLDVLSTTKGGSGVEGDVARGSWYKANFSLRCSGVES